MSLENKYFAELARRLRAAGITAGHPEKNRLTVLLNNQPVLSVSAGSDVFLLPAGSNQPEAGELYHKVAQTADEVYAYRMTGDKEVQILRMTLDELINAMEPQARKDKALISKCVDGLTEYAAELRQKAGDAGKEQISALRRLVDELAGYRDTTQIRRRLLCIRKSYCSSA